MGREGDIKKSMYISDEGGKKERENNERERIINAHRPPASARMRRFGPKFFKRGRVI